MLKLITTYVQHKNLQRLRNQQAKTQHTLILQCLKLPQKLKISEYPQMKKIEIKLPPWTR